MTSTRRGIGEERSRRGGGSVEVSGSLGPVADGSRRSKAGFWETRTEVRGRVRTRRAVPPTAEARGGNRPEGKVRNRKQETENRKQMVETAGERRAGVGWAAPNAILDASELRSTSICTGKQRAVAEDWRDAKRNIEKEMEGQRERTQRPTDGHQDHCLPGELSIYGGRDLWRTAFVWCSSGVRLVSRRSM